MAETDSTTQRGMGWLWGLVILLILLAGAWWWIQGTSESPEPATGQADVSLTSAAPGDPIP